MVRNKEILRKEIKTSGLPSLPYIEIWYVFQWPYTRFNTWVKFEVFANDCPDEVWRNYFSFMEIFIIWSFYPGTHCRLITSVNTSTCFKPPSSQLFESVEYFIFGAFPFHIKSFCILLSWLIIACRTVVISDRWAILEIAWKLKPFLQSLGFS